MAVHTTTSSITGTPLQRLILYSNKLVQAWINNQVATLKSHICEQQKSKGTVFAPNGMPEPYLGDPYKCSAVIININPGGVIPCNDWNHKNEASNFIKKYFSNNGTYYDFAKDFPYLNYLKTSEPDNKGSIWWEQRLNWINNIIRKSGRIKANEEIPLPFNLEICPWHSKRWKGMKLSNPCLQKYIREYVIEPACEAIGYSQLPFGLIVGKAVCDAIQKADCNWVIIKTWDKGTSNLSTAWPSGNKGKINRHYALLSNGTHFFLCTWAPGSNHVPQKDFCPVEQTIINDVLAVINNIHP